LTLRADYLGAHSGQISLPGGKAEPGESYVETALRECEEEIGVEQSTLEVVGRLSDFFVIPSNFLVSPVVGVSRTKPEFKADPVEVVKILEADVLDLIREDAIHQKEILAAKQYRMMAPHFEIEGEVVWGATAMMLNELRRVLREILHNPEKAQFYLGGIGSFIVLFSSFSDKINTTMPAMTIGENLSAKGIFLFTEKLFDLNTTPFLSKTSIV
jgi:hypothetical protein